MKIWFMAVKRMSNDDSYSDDYDNDDDDDGNGNNENE